MLSYRFGLCNKNMDKDPAITIWLRSGWAHNKDGERERLHCLIYLLYFPDLLLLWQKKKKRCGNDNKVKNDDGVDSCTA